MTVGYSLAIDQDALKYTKSSQTQPYKRKRLLARVCCPLVSLGIPCEKRTASAWKACIWGDLYRGFKSLPLRQRHIKRFIPRVLRSLEGCVVG
jgi:hypothetical protein